MKTTLTRFQVIEKRIVPSTDCHTIEQYCMSVFGQETSPNPNVEVTILDSIEIPDPNEPETPPEEEPEDPDIPPVTETPNPHLTSEDDGHPAE